MQWSPKQYHTHIEPAAGWLRIPLGELWRYRDLIWLLTKKSFILVYKQTVLGPLWILLQPLLTTLIYTLVFGGIAGISTDGAPQLLFYMGGHAVWTFFSASLTRTAGTFVNNAHVLGKVYFPRLAMPVSSVLTGLINFGVQMLMFLALWMYYVISGAVSPNGWGILLLPLVLLQLGLLGLGCGLIIAGLTAKYRDLSLLVGFGVQLWMYITPVVYPVSALGDGTLRSAILLNPATCAVETFRWMFLGVGSPDVAAWVCSCAVTAVILLAGLVIFTRVEKTFMDTV